AAAGRDVRRRRPRAADQPPPEPAHVMTAALTIDRLRVTYPGPPPVRAVDDLSLTIAAGECLGILGESGSGKSTLGRSVLGLAGPAAVEGSIRLGDVDLTALDEDGWRHIRWRRISMAMQSAASLNPVLRVGLQLAEPQQVHLQRSRAAADAASAAWSCWPWPSSVIPRCWCSTNPPPGSTPPPATGCWRSSAASGEKGGGRWW